MVKMKHTVSASVVIFIFYFCIYVCRCSSLINADSLILTALPSHVLRTLALFSVNSHDVRTLRDGSPGSQLNQ